MRSDRQCTCHVRVHCMLQLCHFEFGRGTVTSRGAYDFQQR